MKDREIHNLLEVALTLKIPLTAVVADVTVTYPNEHDRKVTCTKIKAGIAMPPARAKECLLHELGDEPGEIQVLRGDEPLPDMVAEGARALQKSLTNLLQAIGAGEPDGATAENLVHAFRLSRKTRQEQPAVDTGSCARAAACDFQAFMLRGLIDVLAYLSIATEVTGQYLGGCGSHE